MKIYRQNGTPVAKEHAMERKKVFNAEFDKIEAEFGLPTSDKPEILEIYTNRLKELDTEFIEKYPIFEEIEFPASAKKFKGLVEKYGGPICFCIEEHDVVGYIMPTAEDLA